MSLSAKQIRSQLQHLRPFLQGCSPELLRRGQNKVGEWMEAKYRDEVVSREHPFAAFSGGWMIPRDTRREGVVLYLHGGGYTCGDLE